jgi:tRNA (mo5U34)-methyltransferase
VTPDSASLAERVAAHDWYHTLELGPGVRTPGWFDTRKVPQLVGFPASLSGARCLDVGTFDGFWAFEMERRGAAEVTAIDVLDPSGWDWPADATDEMAAAMEERKAKGAGFELAREALGSAVDRLELSVYDLDPAAVGRFDFVYLGSLLLHLRDPIGALMKVRSVCSGDLLLADAIDLRLAPLRRRPAATLEGQVRPWWWKPNAAGLARMAEAAGFTVVDGPRTFWMPPGPAITGMSGELRPFLRGAREWMLAHRKGDPHAALRCRPASGPSGGAAPRAARGST